MEITLEKIELVKDRTGVSYKEAKEALEACEGSVVDAIILIEQKVDEDSTATKAEAVTSDLIEKLKALVKKGNVTKISIKKGDNVIANVPVNAGIIGVALAPWTMLIAAIVTFGNSCKVEIVTDDGKTIDVSEKVQGGVDYAKEKGGQAWDFAKEKGPEVWNFAKEKGEQAWDFAKEEGTKAWDYAKEKAPEVWEAAKEEGTKAWDYAKEKAPEVWETAKEEGTKAWDYAKEKAPEVWETAKEGGEKAFDYAKNRGMDAWDFAKEKLEERKNGKDGKLFDNVDFSDDDTKLGKEDEK